MTRSIGIAGSTPGPRPFIETRPGTRTKPPLLGAFRDVTFLDEPATKQVIVMRRDLGMRRGKEIAQGAHASMIWLAERIRHRRYTFSEAERQWLAGAFTKVCVRVDSEEELLGIVRAAEEHGVMVHLVIDAGRTEFRGVPTPTCCALGPDFAERIDPITGHLKLL
jgi:peptidyl-tRNA hydrolase, PTH2 family